MSKRVKGKVALITGAARGQGRAHAVKLAAEGADVVAVDICDTLPHVQYPSTTREDLAETVRQVEKLDRRIVEVVADVRDLDTLRAAVDNAVGDLGRLDIVVANAGICAPMPWDQVTPAVLEDHLDINVTGVWNTVMVAAPHLITAGGGSIILISSSAGLKPQPFLLHYTTSKWAVRGMAKAFAAELARHNIRVNSVHPGAIDTPMTTGATQADGTDMGQTFAALPDARLLGMFTPLLPVQLIEPESVADSVLFLASDDSKYLTAHEIAPDAGTSEF